MKGEVAIVKDPCRFLCHFQAVSIIVPISGVPAGVTSSILMSYCSVV